jgi:hypothetical protein
MPNTPHLSVPAATLDFPTTESPAMTTATTTPADTAALLTDDQLVQAILGRLLDMVGTLAGSEPEARIAGIIVERRELRPAPAPRGAKVNDRDVYATVACGALRAEVVRCCDWDASDGIDTVDISFEARINRLREDGGGAAEIFATDSTELFELAQVAVQTALLLGEARRS